MRRGLASSTPLTDTKDMLTTQTGELDGPAATIRDPAPPTMVSPNAPAHAAPHMSPTLVSAQGLDVVAPRPAPEVVVVAPPPAPLPPQPRAAPLPTRPMPPQQVAAPPMQQPAVNAYV